MIDSRHFRLLREFGRSELARQLREQRKKPGEPTEGENQLWAHSIQQSGLESVSLRDVVAAWKDYVEGSSNQSGLVVNGDVDPIYVSVGVTWRGVITAAHTTRTEALIRRLLEIYARSFPTPEAFYLRLLELCPKPKVV